jgi:hypothetical protein
MGDQDGIGEKQTKCTLPRLLLSFSGVCNGVFWDVVGFWDAFLGIRNYGSWDKGNSGYTRESRKYCISLRNIRQIVHTRCMSILSMTKIFCDEGSGGADRLRRPATRSQSQSSVSSRRSAPRCRLGPQNEQFSPLSTSASF